MAPRVLLRALAGVTAIAIALPLFAQATDGPPVMQLTQTQAREDLERLRFTIEHAHGNAYRYISRKALDRKFSKASASIKGPISDLDLFRTVAPLVGAVRDSHTSIELPETLLNHFRSNKRSAFPLDIRMVKGRALVEADLGSEDVKVQPVSEILSIEGKPMPEIVRTIGAQISTDGYIPTAREYRLNNDFWFFYAVGYGTRADYSVTLRDPATGRTSVRTLRGIPPRPLALRNARPPGQASQRLEYPERHVALLTLDEMSSPTTGEFLDRSFADIAQKGATDLIIDLRRCPGGDDRFNHELLSYLSPRPFRLYSSRVFRVRSYSDIKYTDYSIDDFITPEQVQLLPPEKRADPLKSMTLPELLRFMLSADDAHGTYAPAARNRLNGRAYLLVGGRSSSSAAEIAALSHHLKLATIVGEEPNGAYQGVTAEAVPILTLPHSKIRIHIPLVADHNAVTPGIFEGRGAPPDFPVAQTISDSIAGRDTVLMFTLDLIRQGSERASRMKRR